jgi:hypothetical protein
MGQLQKLQNIGSKTEAQLNELGIHTREDLEKFGTFEAWMGIRQNYPNKDVCICCLYALVGALEGICWYELPKDLKTKLQEEAARHKS